MLHPVAGRALPSPTAAALTRHHDHIGPSCCCLELTSVVQRPVVMLSCLSPAMSDRRRASVAAAPGTGPPGTAQVNQGSHAVSRLTTEGDTASAARSPCPNIQKSVMRVMEAQPGLRRQAGAGVPPKGGRDGR